MNLMYTNCVPILTYACEVKSYTSREMTRFDVALNDCIRKIFTFNRWESTRELRRSFGYDSILEIYAKRQRNFFSCLRLTGNPVLVKLRSLTLTETNQWYWLNYCSTFMQFFFLFLLFSEWWMYVLSQILLTNKQHVSINDYCDIMAVQLLTL